MSHLRETISFLRMRMQSRITPMFEARRSTCHGTSRVLVPGMFHETGYS